MCSSDLISFNGWPSTFLPKMFLKKAKVLRLINSRARPSTGRRIRLKKRCQIREEEMKMVNMRLFFENKLIMEENKRLRERALFLSQESQALLAQLQTTKKSSNFSAPLL